MATGGAQWRTTKGGKRVAVKNGTILGALAGHEHEERVLQDAAGRVAIRYEQTPVPTQTFADEERAIAEIMQGVPNSTIAQRSRIYNQIKRSMGVVGTETYSRGKVDERIVPLYNTTVKLPDSTIWFSRHGTAKLLKELQSSLPRPMW